MHIIQPCTTHLRASKSTLKQCCLLQQVRATTSPARPHATLVRAPRVEPGAPPTAGTRHSTIPSATGPAVATQESKTDSPVKDSRTQKVVLNTIESKRQKAYYLAPKDPAAARGVVLFLHGFSQSPKAYALLYEALVANNLLVVAPDPQPMISLSAKELQGAIVASAEFWGKLLWNNEFPPIKLAPETAHNIGLLGHSVGAGLATYVAKQAAFAERPFKAVMYMAPQTQVYSKYLPATAIKEWRKREPELESTNFGLQWGCADWIAPFFLSLQLDQQLKKISKREIFCLGTHQGFEGQLFIGDVDANDDLLPYANVVLMVLTLCIAAGLRGVDPLPLMRFLLQSAARKGQDEEGSGGVAGDACASSLGPSIAGGFIDAKEILDMPSRSAISTPAAAPADGGAEAPAAPAPDVAAEAELGLSAGEKALLLLQMALTDQRRSDPSAQPLIRQQPLGASDKPVKGTEIVNILPYKQAWWEYFTVLLPFVGLCAATALASDATEFASLRCTEWQTLLRLRLPAAWYSVLLSTEYHRPCMCILTFISTSFGALAVLLGLITACGVVALGVQSYVDLVQRPDSRVKAAEFFKQHLNPLNPKPKQR